MRTLCCLLAGLVFAWGCQGPLTAPMVKRLSPDDQRIVDESWDNMFTPSDRLDRHLLLDTVLLHQFHQQGVDRLRMVSEKFVRDGLVAMEVDFDRANPKFDAFTVTYMDADGNEIRRERYTYAEIQEAIDFLSGPLGLPDTPEMTEEERQAILEAQAAREERLKEIRAATQPALGD